MVCFVLCFGPREQGGRQIDLCTDGLQEGLGKGRDVLGLPYWPSHSRAAGCMVLGAGKQADDAVIALHATTHTVLRPAKLLL